MEDLFRTVGAVGLGAWRHRPPWNMYRFLMETCSCNAENNAEKCRKRRFRASKFATFSLPPIMVGEVTRKLVNLIYTCPFFFTLTLFESWFVGPAFPEIFSKSFFFRIFSMVPLAYSITKMGIHVQKIQIHVPCNIFLIWTTPYVVAYLPAEKFQTCF